MARYYDCWSSWKDVANDYPELPEESKVIYAGYTYEDYSGSALVVFVENGKLYENHDGHCSCNGLDNWHPEEANIKAVLGYQDWPGLPEAVFDYVAAKFEAFYIEPNKPRAIRLRH